MEYYALCDREMVVIDKDSVNCDLSLSDIIILIEHCKVLDKFFESELGQGMNDFNTVTELHEINDGLIVISLNKEIELPNGYKWIPIRERFSDLEYDEEACFSLSRAKALLEWRNKTKYCGSCGEELNDHESMTARVCPACGTIVFPRIEPCIIVLVHRDDKILLARHVQRNQQIYACIAGFMEAGETAEHAVEREIYEETGIKVKNVKYFGSQSWPFPSQLMLAFTAEYESGELRLQKDELADAGWFTTENCPASPQPGSIAYRLIHES